MVIYVKYTGIKLFHWKEIELVSIMQQIVAKCLKKKKNDIIQTGKIKPATDRKVKAEDSEEISLFWQHKQEENTSNF